MLKILFLPVNIASQPFITTEAINKTGKAKALCITNSVSPVNSKGKNTLFIPKNFPRRKPFKWLYYKLTYRHRIKKWIKWADVLHYIWSPAFTDGGDLQYAEKLGKPIFIEWVGSDIRKPEKLSKINNYYSKAFKSGYEYFDLESSGHSETVQQQFSKAGAIPLATPEMSIYIDRNYFTNGSKTLMARLNVNDFTPSYPGLENKKPLVVHSPTARVCKGSSYIIDAVSRLQRKYDFDFKLIENMPREQALKLTAGCDIFIDQLILGSYGLASVEAMSMGKPVICYIMKEVFDAGLPAECPIINASPETITDELEKLITNPSLRRERGMSGRQYATEHHNAEAICNELIHMYEEAHNKVRENRQA